MVTSIGNFSQAILFMVGGRILVQLKGCMEKSPK